MEQQMKQYCRQLKDLLVCPPEDAKRCIAEVRQSVELLREERPEITEEELRDFLEEPEEVAQTFLGTLDPVQLYQYRSRKKLFLRLLIGMLLAAIWTALSVACYFMMNPQWTYTTELRIYDSYEDPSDDPEATDPYADGDNPNLSVDGGLGGEM